MAPLHGKLPGALIVAAIALAAFAIARLAAPLGAVDATLVALLLGIVTGAALRHPAALEPGAGATLKHALTWGVVLLGAQIDLRFLFFAGARGVLLAAALILFTLALFFALARALRVSGDAWALLGAGTAICGLSAVIAAGATLRSREQDIAVAAAGVGILSAVGLLVYPMIGLVGVVPEDVFGAWSGMSVHAVANAVAAGFAIGPEAGRMATLTKLTRVALLAPALVALGFLARTGEHRTAGGPRSWLPGMVWGFLGMVTLVSLIPLPAPLLEALHAGARTFLLLGIAGLGYTTRLAGFRSTGARGLALATLGWFGLSITALAGSYLVYG